MIGYNLIISQKVSEWLSKNRQIRKAREFREIKRTSVRCNDETICSNAGAGDFCDANQSRWRWLSKNRQIQDARISRNEAYFSTLQ